MLFCADSINLYSTILRQQLFSNIEICRFKRNLRDLEVQMLNLLVRVHLEKIMLQTRYNLILRGKCKHHSFSEMQFECVPKRGTYTATPSLINDVITYVTTCNILFRHARRYPAYCKARKVLQDNSWRVMPEWYFNISVTKNKTSL